MQPQISLTRCLGGGGGEGDMGAMVVGMNGAKLAAICTCSSRRRFDIPCPDASMIRMLACASAVQEIRLVHLPLNLPGGPPASTSTAKHAASGGEGGFRNAPGTALSAVQKAPKGQRGHWWELTYTRGVGGEEGHRQHGTPLHNAGRVHRPCFLPPSLRRSQMSREEQSAKSRKPRGRKGPGKAKQKHVREVRPTGRARQGR
jgi:hypothetical protein